MSTTEILFNSPALHSLKRNQLVQLCKQHGVKANGKNIELINRLKQHALTLPPDSPLNVAVRSEAQTGYRGMDIDTEEDENGDVENRYRASRPSELWEVVMEDIPEETGESQGSLSSLKSTKFNQATGEFGSVKAASVTSSIKAIATSLGLKRTMNTDTIASESSNTNSTRKALSDFITNKSLNSNARDSLTAHAIPYSSLPPTTPSSLPKTDPFNFDYADTTIASIDLPIPGLPGFEGVEATDAQASTIRLVSVPQRPLIPSPPKLRPFETAFDLVPNTPGGSFSEKISRWPLSPQASECIYPTISSGIQKENDTEDIEMPGGLSPSRGYRNLAALANKSAFPSNGTNLLSQGRLEPFIFGSSNPRYSLSNKDFTNAANSVLADFNARLGLNGQDALGMDILKNRALGKGNNDGNPASMGVSIDNTIVSGWRFEKAHEEEFKKMPSIKDHYAAKRGSQQDTGMRNKKRKSSALGVGRPGVPINRRRSSTRVISAGTRKRMVPGAFSDDGEEEEAMEEDEENRRLSKKPRLSELPQDEVEHMDESEEKHVAIASGSGKTNDDDEEEDRKDREAIKRRLEYKKAKRRSTMNRVSVGGGRAPLIPNQKHKGANSRFGFLASAKSLVKSVWNRGAGGTTSSTIPVPKVNVVSMTSSLDKKQDKTSAKSKSTVGSSAKDKIAKPSLQGLKPPSVNKPASRSASGESSRSLKPSSAASVTSSTGRSRSPLPVFSVSSSSIKSTATSAHPTSVRSKAGSSVGAGGKTKTSSSAVSSMGTRRSIANTGTSSMGTKKSLSSAAENNSTSKAIRDISARKRSSSTLLAPTASSLAKMTSRPSAAGRDRTASSGSKLPSIHEQKVKAVSSPKQDENILPEGPTAPLSPKTKSNSIFSQPLVFEDNTNNVSRADENNNKILYNPFSGLPTSNASHTKEGEVGKRVANDTQKEVSLKRRPRISRSKIIAKLDAKRASASASMSTAAGVAAASRRGRTRSSIGTTAASKPGRIPKGADSDVLMSAKKRARKSEYIRRQNARASSNVAVEKVSMDVDEL